MSTPATQLPGFAPAVLRPGVKTLLLGGSGGGKTFCLRTLVEAGLEVFVISTEPGIANVLGDVPSDKLHWNYLPPLPLSLDALYKQVESINSRTLKELADQVVDRSQFRQMLDFINILKNFKCQRTGKEFGDVTKWDSSRVLVVDSLSGLTMMMVNATIGTKVVVSLPDYGIIQTALERQINSLCMVLNCHFVMTAHVEREMDETTGAISLMASTLGKKLAPKLPRFFDDVIFVKRDGLTFFWSTASYGVDTKSRLLPIKDKLDPSFVPLIKAWKAKNPT